MDITVKVEDKEEIRNFIDFAARLTLKATLDDFEKVGMGMRFRDIINRVRPAPDGTGMKPEDVTADLHEFFKDNNYQVSRAHCLKILQYHQQHKFKEHWSQGGGPNY